MQCKLFPGSMTTGTRYLAQRPHGSPCSQPKCCKCQRNQGWAMRLLQFKWCSEVAVGTVSFGSCTGVFGHCILNTSTFWLNMMMLYTTVYTEKHLKTLWCRFFGIYVIIISQTNCVLSCKVVKHSCNPFLITHIACFKMLHSCSVIYEYECLRNSVHIKSGDSAWNHPRLVKVLLIVIIFGKCIGVILTFAFSFLSRTCASQGDKHPDMKSTIAERVRHSLGLSLRRMDPKCVACNSLCVDPLVQKPLIWMLMQVCWHIGDSIFCLQYSGQ